MVVSMVVSMVVLTVDVQEEDSVAKDLQVAIRAGMMVEVDSVGKGAIPEEER